MLIFWQNLPAKVGPDNGRYERYLTWLIPFIGEWVMKIKAFTLYEVVVVVVLLGILAAILVPTLQGHTMSARESAVKDCLMTMRTQIQLYKMEHDGFLPGYVNGAGAPTATLQLQFIGTTTVLGLASPSKVPSAPFIYGPYVMKLPENPFNNRTDIKYVPEGTDFSFAVNSSTSGWLYKKETGEFVINWHGTDSKGEYIYEY
ncbi:MAG: type IV pilin protein [Planctomycetota bacterium]